MKNAFRRSIPVYLLIAAACGGGEEAPPISVGVDAGSSLDGAICQPDAPCSCGTATGTRVCSDGGAGECSCQNVVIVPPAPPMLTDTSGDCLAGRYIGNFDGNAGFIVTVTPISGMGLLGDIIPLEIMLERDAMSSEFALVGNGALRGNANGTFPFEATIMGELDCSTKRYNATIAGTVGLFGNDVRNSFTGTMVANYDGATHALKDGVWTVTGSNADGGVDFGLTGGGKWHAEYVGEGAALSSDGGASDAGTLDAGIRDGGP